MRRPATGRRWPLAPALSDALALVVFACIGLVSHDGSLLPARLAGDALPLLGGWFAAALALRTYVRPGRDRFLATWAVGVPLGVAARALVLQRPLDGGQAAFLATSLAFTLLLLLLGRALLALAARPRRPRAGGSARQDPQSGRL